MPFPSMRVKWNRSLDGGIHRHRPGQNSPPQEFDVISTEDDGSSEKSSVHSFSSQSKGFFNLFRTKRHGSCRKNDDDQSASSEHFQRRVSLPARLVRRRPPPPPPPPSLSDDTTPSLSQSSSLSVCQPTSTESTPTASQSIKSLGSTERHNLLDAAKCFFTSRTKSTAKKTSANRQHGANLKRSVSVSDGHTSRNNPLLSDQRASVSNVQEADHLPNRVVSKVNEFFSKFGSRSSDTAVSRSDHDILTSHEYGPSSSQVSVEKSLSTNGQFSLGDGGNSAMPTENEIVVEEYENVVSAFARPDIIKDRSCYALDDRQTMCNISDAACRKVNLGRKWPEFENDVQSAKTCRIPAEDRHGVVSSSSFMRSSPNVTFSTFKSAECYNEVVTCKENRLHTDPISNDELLRRFDSLSSGNDHHNSSFYPADSQQLKKGHSRARFVSIDSKKVNSSVPIGYEGVASILNKSKSTLNETVAIKCTLNENSAPLNENNTIKASLCKGETIRFDLNDKSAVRSSCNDNEAVVNERKTVISNLDLSQSTLSECETVRAVYLSKSKPVSSISNVKDDVLNGGNSFEFIESGRSIESGTVTSNDRSSSECKVSNFHDIEATRCILNNSDGIEFAFNESNPVESSMNECESNWNEREMTRSILNESLKSIAQCLEELDRETAAISDNDFNHNVNPQSVSKVDDDDHSMSSRVNMDESISFPSSMNGNYAFVNQERVSLEGTLRCPGTDELSAGGRKKSPLRDGRASVTGGQVESSSSADSLLTLLKQILPEQDGMLTGNNGLQSAVVEADEEMKQTPCTDDKEDECEKLFLEACLQLCAEPEKQTMPSSELENPLIPCNLEQPQICDHLQESSTVNYKEDQGKVLCLDKHITSSECNKFPSSSNNVLDSDQVDDLPSASFSEDFVIDQCLDGTLPASSPSSEVTCSKSLEDRDLIKVKIPGDSSIADDTIHKEKTENVTEKKSSVTKVPTKNKVSSIPKNCSSTNKGNVKNISTDDKGTIVKAIGTNVKKISVDVRDIGAEVKHITVSKNSGTNAKSGISNMPTDVKSKSTKTKDVPVVIKDVPMNLKHVPTDAKNILTEKDVKTASTDGKDTKITAQPAGAVKDSDIDINHVKKMRIDPKSCPNSKEKSVKPTPLNLRYKNRMKSKLAEASDKPNSSPINLNTNSPCAKFTSDLPQNESLTVKSLSCIPCTVSLTSSHDSNSISKCKSEGHLSSRHKVRLSSDLRTSDLLESILQVRRCSTSALGLPGEEHVSLTRLDSGSNLQPEGLGQVRCSSVIGISTNESRQAARNLPKSRIPKKHGGCTRPLVAPRPVRPPMWLSKAELSQEIQHLSTLCEARTKELNRLKMDTRHVASGFDALSVVIRYMSSEMNAFRNPSLATDLKEAQDHLSKGKKDIEFYEKEIEKLNLLHVEEVNKLSQKFTTDHEYKIQTLIQKHSEQMKSLNEQHEKEARILTDALQASCEEERQQHAKMLDDLQLELKKQREEMEIFHQHELDDLEELHLEKQKSLLAEVEKLQKQCEEAKQLSLNIEDALQKDTDSKLQWLSAKRLDLQNEVDSLKAVLEIKNNELHSLRKENLEMQKELEDLPLAREKIKMLQARAEDLQALMAEKVRLERQISTEHEAMKEVFEREEKLNKRLSMENEELVWKLKQATENSLMSTSLPDEDECEDVDEPIVNLSSSCPPAVFQEDEADESPSPTPKPASKPRFFTYMNQEELNALPQSPRTQYKGIQPHNSVQKDKTRSPRRSTDSSPHYSEGTPRKVARHIGRNISNRRRTNSGSNDKSTKTTAPDSALSSASSDNSLFDPCLQDDQKQLTAADIQSSRLRFEIEVGMEVNSNDEDLCLDFDPKTYYHMTFPVKESAQDNEDPMKDL